MVSLDMTSAGQATEGKINHTSPKLNVLCFQGHDYKSGKMILRLGENICKSDIR